LELLRQEVMKWNSDITTLQKLKQIAIDIECRQLEDTVNTINSAMAESLLSFFNEPISVTLKLYKTLKTKKCLKPGVNLSIKYKGTEYDAITQLSGGEGDRISLALIMALNSINSSPFLLLDECMTSFDSHLKEECIKTLKTLTNKIIICVDHGDIDGFYDKVIPISS
jgi:chromosome segregation ATPase